MHIITGRAGQCPACTALQYTKPPSTTPTDQDSPSQGFGFFWLITSALGTVDSLLLSDSVVTKNNPQKHLPKACSVLYCLRATWASGAETPTTTHHHQSPTTHHHHPPRRKGVFAPTPVRLSTAARAGATTRTDQFDKSG